MSFFEIKVFDNGGKTLDRYTIVNFSRGDVLTASENPSEPNGVGQYSHNILPEINAGKIPVFDGKEIKIKDLPEKVQIFIAKAIC